MTDHLRTLFVLNEDIQVYLSKIDDGIMKNT